MYLMIPLLGTTNMRHFILCNLYKNVQLLSNDISVKILVI